ncbi:toll/interleukin-1 receptor domain-containing protein [Williamsia muralis]|uniref:Toll/interleukin-1 receptor domain-containing protein n=1 Tax=Williamsia marianensis TaxID=85044 RepID=A0ABU4F0P7_WILMA|nr:toll/interleukin-1 receptor domain-containing protein [Williamsia muralis]MDV7137074.1 toll/interleukin-1 receptor domain-containing protein [Williamsia muralis]
MVAVNYEVQVVHVDHDDWAADLRQALSSELLRIGMHTSVTVDVTTAPPTLRAPSVAVAFLGPSLKLEVSAISQIDAAVRAGRVVIPVVDDLSTFQAESPPSLSPINGFEWSGEVPERRLAQLILEELGIEDRDRRVFLSHKRSDGLGAAEQLHDELTRNRFVPFVDRFAMLPGVDVQTHIADALEDFAFLLVLETEEAYLSDWVFDEIDYALSHTMGMLIVQWPNVVSEIPGTQGVPRVRLADDDIEDNDHGYQVLKPAVLDSLIRDVEVAHASGIVRRRRMLVSSVEDAARTAGATCIPLRDWCIDVDAASGRSIVGVTPRLPATEDLQLVDDTRASIDPGAGALLVHPTRRIREPTRKHLDWVIGIRNLELLPDNAIGARW